MRTAFPDLSVSPDTVVADDESIAFRLHPRRNPHMGRSWAFRRPGRRSKYAVVQFSKFKDGKMVERWGSSDELGLLTQLGVGPLAAA